MTESTAAPDSPGSPAWLDAQYNNRARVPQAVQHLQRWAADSAAARAELLARGQAVLDVPYMDQSGLSPAAQTVDVFTPPASATPPAGGWPVLVFVHGGYWRALDKADHSFIAPPWVNAAVGPGAIVVVPNYALCPAVTVGTITAQMQQAVAWTWRHIARHGGNPQRITVAGHSAGGHGVGMLLATPLAHWQALGVATEAGGTSPVRHGVSISGLFDLAPIAHTPFLADLRLSPEEAQAQSPIHHPPTGGPLTAVVGGDESEEFLRQNGLLRQAWGEAAAPVAEVLPGLNHFSVVEELAQPASRLSAWVAEKL
ncbi:alpha/beta hydrolase [Hydrogenophaga soli]